jgi:predicted NBD/HSP70 family sugar kinase
MAATRLPGTPRLLRALNDRAALELLLARGPLTRAQLGELTGLSKVTASQLVERLEERGLVRRVGEQAGGRGPNAQLYAVTPGSAHVIGVDVGPERVVAACADITGAIIGQVEQSTKDTDDPIGVVHRAVVQAATEAGAEMSSVRRVVLGTPGLVDPKTGEISFAWDLPRWHRGLLDDLRRDLSTPVVFGNDVNLAAVAEQSVGAAAGVTDFVLIWIGRGVGLASVIDGRLHQGSTGAAGEIGFLPVAGADVPRNSAKRAAKGGVRGAFQSIAGADAVKAIGKKYGFRGNEAADVVHAAVTTTSRTRSAGGTCSAKRPVVMPMRVRSSLTSTRPSRSPSTQACPREGCRRADARLSRVVLPAPLGPRITHRSSSSTCQDRLRTRKFPDRITLTRSNAMTVSSSGGRVTEGGVSVGSSTAPSNHAGRWRPLCGGRAEHLVADRVERGVQGAVQHRLGRHLGDHHLG